MVAIKKSHVTKHIKNSMLRHEACAMALLTGHPSIPSVYAWGRSQYYEYLATDLLGTPLKKFSVLPTERFELRVVLSILVQMVSRIVLRP
jgi:casein kinase 1